jgi:hypothetical protein
VVAGQLEGLLIEAVSAAGHRSLTGIGEVVTSTWDFRTGDGYGEVGATDTERVGGVGATDAERVSAYDEEVGDATRELGGDAADDHDVAQQTPV